MKILATINAAAWCVLVSNIYTNAPEITNVTELVAQGSWGVLALGMVGLMLWVWGK